MAERDVDLDTDADVDMGDLFDELEELEELVQTEAAREQVQETMRAAAEASRSGGSFGRVIWGYDRADLAEGVLGSLLFGVPMAVEGGTGEVGAFLAARPPLLAGTAVFTVALLVGILYVADFQDIRIHRPFLGIVPRRLLGVAAVSLLTAAILLTAWGRVDWTEPMLAMANVVVAWFPMSIGAALGDILPGS
ncbi:DUF2391 family protein [Salinirussus salinus]|jgi:uncharacterized membrane protein|uniref:DUF2391 family protein n=1 Tax=Salinirussus salinus TaxID=1198300 RepID=UPI00135CEDDE|nr:DUF2391 family protein [Salinirussus salinus]